jgi:hypothetical protein
VQRRGALVAADALEHLRRGKRRDVDGGDLVEPEALPADFMQPQRRGENEHEDYRDGFADA